eukprot:2527615-Rhodomonas_salina.1
MHFSAVSVQFVRGMRRLALDFAASENLMMCIYYRYLPQASMAPLLLVCHVRINPVGRLVQTVQAVHADDVGVRGHVMARANSGSRDGARARHVSARRSRTFLRSDSSSRWQPEFTALT